MEPIFLFAMLLFNPYPGSRFFVQDDYKYAMLYAMPVFNLSTNFEVVLNDENEECIQFYNEDKMDDQAIILKLQEMNQGGWETYDEDVNKLMFLEGNDQLFFYFNLRKELK